MHIISAEIEDFGMELTNICCFDPRIIVSRLRQTIPETQVELDDLAWKSHMYFTQPDSPSSPEAIRIAKFDALRRGPIFPFQLPIPNFGVISGRAERYVVEFRSDCLIPEPHRSQLIAFCQGLQFASCVDVKSVWLSENGETPA